MSTPSHKEKVETKFNLLPYAGHVAAPPIRPTDLTAFKRTAITKVEKVLDRKFQELIKQAEDLQNLFNINQEVYDSIYKFEPIVGEIYHLYEDSNGNKTLSIISPSQWKMKHLYSVVLNSDMTWTKIDEIY